LGSNGPAIGDAVTGTVAEVEPAGMVTVGGTVATAGSLLVSWMTTSPTTTGSTKILELVSVEPQVIGLGAQNADRSETGKMSSPVI
jgi:hypothetical protein